jgi:hypothetical protein
MSSPVHPTGPYTPRRRCKRGEVDKRREKDDNRGMTDAHTPEQAEQMAWITLREAGEMVGVSSMTIRRAVKAGKIVGQKGDGPSDPWMVRRFDVEARWRTGTAPPAPVTVVDTTLAPQIETLAQLLNEALKAEGDARERAARAEAEVEHLRERLNEIRDDKKPDTPSPVAETEPTRRRLRWWPGRKR